ncbi:MAG: sigma-54-dependent Fis family transcriptional regulator [Clostridiales bacterium]|nr:sigma-54-dependent Fis family transcriptional regulator [Clostridiales bacterium]
MKNQSILMIDDDLELLAVYKKILELKGFSILTAGNGEEALEILKKNSIAVVILDIIMPKIDGMEMLNRIKKNWPSVEVIMLTAEGSISGAVDAVKQGAYTYFVKPADIDDLILNIGKAQELFNIRMENTNLKQQLEYVSSDTEFIGESKVAADLRDEAAIVGRADSAVMITGESGTGKEVLAHMIHRLSNRRDKPFVSVNCAALNENLIERELFGSEKGAYTGAEKQHKGRFEIADGGTIFFDEIGELSLNIQVKLLRVMQEKSFERVGGNDTIESDFRLISATNRDLKKAVDEGKFRLDLYYRINIIPMEIPPLRKRKEDIPLLCNAFLAEFSKDTKKTIEPFSDDVIRQLQSYDWPGNVRELRNIIERLVVLAFGGVITVEDLPAEIRDIDSTAQGSEELKDATKEFEKEYITDVMRRNGWNVTKAAKELNIARKNLYKKLNDYGIKYR